MSLLSKHKEVESELAAARERLQQQATDLVLKASMYDLEMNFIHLFSPFLFLLTLCRFRVPKDCSMLSIEISGKLWAF